MSLIEKYIVEAKKDEQRVLRIMTMDDVMNDTPITQLKSVAKGTFKDLQVYAKKKKLIWNNSPKQIFGGYWYDKKNGEAYMIT